MALDKILTVKGRAVPFMGDDIDTDRIIPARFMKCVTFDGLGEFAFFDSRKEFQNAGKVHPVDDPRFTGASILISGANFGCGSSREHAPIAIKAAGISCVVAHSFARIFYRNAINIGLPILESPEAAASLEEGEDVKVDFMEGKIVNSCEKVFDASPFPEFMQGIMAAGGLISYVRTKLEKENTRG